MMTSHPQCYISAETSVHVLKISYVAAAGVHTHERVMLYEWHALLVPSRHTWPPSFSTKRKYIHPGLRDDVTPSPRSVSASRPVDQESLQAMASSHSTEQNINAQRITALRGLNHSYVWPFYLNLVVCLLPPPLLRSFQRIHMQPLTKFIRFHSIGYNARAPLSFTRTRTIKVQNHGLAYLQV